MVRAFTANFALVCLELGCGGVTRNNPGDVVEAPRSQGGEAGERADAGSSSGNGGSTSQSGSASGGDASPVNAGGDCGCVSAAVDWWVESGAQLDDLRGKGHLQGCATYGYTSEHIGQPPTKSCTLPLDACEPTYGVDGINTALAHPDVQDALARAPIVFGKDLRAAGAQVDHIEVDGKVIEVGFECEADEACNIPDGIAKLDYLLGRMIARYGSCPP